MSKYCIEYYDMEGDYQEVDLSCDSALTDSMSILDRNGASYEAFDTSTGHKRQLSEVEVYCSGCNYCQPNTFK